MHNLTTVQCNGTKHNFLITAAYAPSLGVVTQVQYNPFADLLAENSIQKFQLW